MTKTFAGSAVLLLLVGCQTAPDRCSDFDWTIGTWRGVRRDAADGGEQPMTMRVEALVAGAGQMRTLAVGDGEATYRGTSVVILDRAHGRWTWQYSNSPERAFARYLGPHAGLRGERMPRSEWRSVSPGRSREARLVSEHLPDGSWRRSMYVAPLGEAAWQLLWVDELRPALAR